MKKLVFISHASDDHILAQKVCTQLERIGISCWIAPRDIMPGQPYGAEIIKAIDMVDGVLLLLTSASNKSLMVHKEVERAISKGKTVYPFRLENITPAEGLEFFISSAHWIDAFNGDLQSGIHALQTVLDPNGELIKTNDFSDHGAAVGVSDLDRDSSQSTKDVNVREFQYHKSRGILINGADGSRNVAFKVETINSIFSQIRSQIEKLASADGVAEIFRQSGLTAGERFGRVMNQRWDLSSEDIDLFQKVTMWCEFDSDVGWGKLSNLLEINERDGIIRGEIRLGENFLIFNKGKCKPSECYFMVGYTQGVLQEVFNGMTVEASCDMSVCPLLNPLKKICVFKINSAAQ